MPAQLEKGYYNSPRWTWEILDCAMPMTFDTYSNCAHQCVYCFAFFQRAVGESKEDYLAHKVTSVSVDRVKRMFLEPDKHAGTFAWYIKGRYVLQWGGLSDGFDWYERNFRKSLELLRFFREIDYPVSISTKGVWFVDDPEYRSALEGATNVHFKYSIITTDPKAASIVELGCPSPDKRFSALKKLKELGVGCTTIRFRPYIIGISDKCEKEIVDRAADAGCYSLTTEFLCLESRASNHARDRYDKISAVAGFDVFPFYRRNSAINTGLLRLNYEIKRPAIERLEKLCADRGLKFYVSDAHHKEASASAGCCGLPETGPLSAINRGQYAEAMQIAKRTGIVRWEDIAIHAEGLKNIPAFKAEGFNVGTTRNKAVRIYQTMFDYMRDVWNSPQLGMSPARYFGGVLVPSGTDRNGDIVYLYNEPQVLSGEKLKTAAGLRKTLADTKEAIRADGERFGHVAFPVFAWVGEKPFDAKSWNEVRLSPTLCCHPAIAEIVSETSGVPEVVALNSKDEIDQHARECGMEWFWILDLDKFEPGPKGPRAFLSEREAKMEPGAWDGAELVVI